MADFILLPNGCKCSQLSVYPKNWDKPGASLKKPWYISYRFYDPTQDKPVQRQIAGMNAFRTLEERRRMTRKILADELELLQVHGFNPFTNSFIKPIPEAGPQPDVLDEHARFGDALELAYKNLKLAPSTMGDLRITIDKVKEAASNITADRQRVIDIPLCELKKKHLRPVLEKCAIRKNDGQYSENQYNRHRTYLMVLFSEMEEVDAVEINLPGSLKKKKTVRRQREVLSLEQRIEIDTYLHADFYPFWRLLHIFFVSGARERELMDVRLEDVDLVKQRVKYLIMKGGQYREEYRTIKTSVLHLWREVVSMAKPGDYLFSRGLVPGKERIRTDQIGKRWYRLVKKRKGVTADFYSLKHLHSTEMKQELGASVAAAHNQHSELVLNKYYDTASVDNNELVKRSSVVFVPAQ